MSPIAAPDAAKESMDLSRLHRISFPKQLDDATSLAAIGLICLLLERREPRIGLVAE
ncbi:hypothetical protein BN2476_490088 [Paraburkholderia piptadeniae]|uniref:Uncharacterized protein n=1 Tax=Paraburkholderia piptadeniae TaxID=1701573 RepID=A0A1N7SF34_9BURK|nr:hypothetical protein [Paraburkholderia piptadeniae]SIT45981.1 hypothetical protein BN2476_490088 [Paraburkholderia piptadeniae]